MTDFLDALAAAGKGAAAGSALGPIGTAGGAALGLAIELMPGLATAIGGNAETAARVVQTVQAVTGTTDPAAQSAALVDPGVAGDLRVQLAQIAADHEAALETERTERIKTALVDVAGARGQTLQLAQTGSKLAWGAPIISVIVLLTFGTLSGLLLFRAVPDPSTGPLQILLGNLGTMAAAVVAYWVGSSSGSSDKSNIIADLAKTTVPASLLPRPAEIKSIETSR